MKRFQRRDPKELSTNIAFLVTDVARLYRTAFDRKMKAQGLNRSEWWLISFLCYFEGHTQQELHQVMDIGAAGLTKLVDRLEKTGMVQRISDSRDRRAKRVFLTERSRPIAASVDRASDLTIADSLARLSPNEQKALRTLLTKIRNDMLAVEPQRRRRTSPGA